MPWHYNYMSGRHSYHPWDGDSDPDHCPTCGAPEEDGAGPEWDVAPWQAEDERIIIPFGHCPTCGWRCEPCPDIEDAYERSDL